MDNMFAAVQGGHDIKVARVLSVGVGSGRRA